MVTARWLITSRQSFSKISKLNLLQCVHYHEETVMILVIIKFEYEKQIVVPEMKGEFSRIPVWPIDSCKK